MVNASLINRLSRVVDLIEQRSRQKRPFKVVKVHRRLEENSDAALERHYAAHPEDRGADVVIFKFFSDGGTADENQNGSPPGADSGI